MECRVKDIPIYYDVRGSGRPLLMIHGFTPDHRLMLGCMEPVFERRDGWQRIYFDLPGMGKTPGPAWLDNSDKMLEVIYQFVQQVLPGQRYCVAGESYGGYMAQGLVMRDADRIEGVLHICPLVNADETQRHLPNHIVMERDEELLSSLASKDRDQFESIGIVLNSKTWEMVKRDVFCGLEAADRAFLDRLFMGYQLTQEAQLEQVVLDKPVLIVVGRQDNVVGYDDVWNWAVGYPHATYAVLDRAGHNLQIEQADLFSALVSEWLSRVEKSWKL